jgi:UDP-glucose 6-dehydrogenase
MDNQNLKVVIIGQGFVGKATALTLNQDVEWHDPPKGLIADYKNSDVVFVCCFDDVLDYYLNELKDHPCVIVRSTLTPDRIHSDSYAVYPEFLVERTWEYDALNPIQIVFGGTEYQFNILKQLSHLDFSDSIITTNKIASLMKVSTNAYLSVKVTIMNLLYQLCGKYNIDFNEFKEVLKVDSRLGHTHFDVPGPDGQFGFGGKCFPKDSKLLLNFLKSNDIDSSLFQSILNINNNLREHNDR